MYLSGGHAYVYFIYGFHNCFNIVTRTEGEPEAVLIRSIIPIQGIEQIRKNRNFQKDKLLCNGPGKLCQALQIDRSHNGILLNSKHLYIEDRGSKVKSIKTSERVGIDYAGDARFWPLRFNAFF